MQKLLIVAAAVAWGCMNCPVQAQIIAAPDAYHDSTGTTNTNTMSPNELWNSQSSYWREHFKTQPYYTSDADYPKYERAYRYGVMLFNTNYGRSYDDLDQSQMSAGWEQARGASPLSWSDAQPAVRDAYTHMTGNQDATGNPATTYETIPPQEQPTK